MEACGFPMDPGHVLEVGDVCSLSSQDTMMSGMGSFGRLGANTYTHMCARNIKLQYNILRYIYIYIYIYIAIGLAADP